MPTPGPVSSIHSLRRRALVLGGACAAGWAAAGPSQAAAGPDPRPAMVDFLRALTSDGERPLTGVSVAWIDGSSRVAQAWAGWRSIGADHPAGSVPLDGQTLFRVASIAKLALAVVALRLHDTRALDLDDDLSPRLGAALRHPAFPDVPITPRLLLSHRSGLLDKAQMPFADGDALRRTLASPAHWGPEPPGRAFRYSNLGAVVLATAMEAATRLPFETMMQRWLFDPIGFQGRYLTGNLQPAQREALSPLYRRPAGSRVWVPQFDQTVSATLPPLPPPGENASVYAPHGGLRASVPDLTRVARLLMQEGRWDGRRLLSADSVEQMLEPQGKPAPDAAGDSAGGLFRAWGLGPQVFRDQSDARGGDRLHPSGGWTGYGHVGRAYGLLAGVLFAPPARSRRPWSLVYVINGTSQAAEESAGLHSSFTRPEEQLLERLLQTIATSRES